MKKMYKISELAEIFEISRQTLIFYHKKGIFVPKEIDKDNGYRYYLKEQMWDLMLILTLKRAGFSLEEIKDLVQNKKMNSNVEFLEKKISEIDIKIENLKNIRKNLEIRIKNFKESNIEENDNIKFEKSKSIYWYSLEMNNPIDEKEMISKYLKLNEIAQKNSIEITEYINILDLKKIKTIGSDDILPILKIGILVPKEKIFKDCKELVVGNSFSITHIDAYVNLYDTYKKLSDYIEKKGYENLDYSIEFMKEVTIPTKNGTGGLLKIMIPVEIDFLR